jgi:hypothetical protein
MYGIPKWHDISHTQYLYPYSHDVSHTNTQDSPQRSWRPRGRQATSATRTCSINCARPSTSAAPYGLPAPTPLIHPTPTPRAPHTSRLNTPQARMRRGMHHARAGVWRPGVRQAYLRRPRPLRSACYIRPCRMRESVEREGGGKRRET